MGDAPRGHHRQVEMVAAGRTEASIQLMDPTSEHKYGGVDHNAIRENDDNEYSMRLLEMRTWDLRAAPEPGVYSSSSSSSPGVGGPRAQW